MSVMCVYGIITYYSYWYIIIFFSVIFDRKFHTFFNDAHCRFQFMIILFEIAVLIIYTSNFTYYRKVFTPRGESYLYVLYFIRLS